MGGEADLVTILYENYDDSDNKDKEMISKKGFSSAIEALNEPATRQAQIIETSHKIEAYNRNDKGPTTAVLN